MKEPFMRVLVAGDCGYIDVVGMTDALLAPTWML
jgi:hypothetical protein